MNNNVQSKRRKIYVGMDVSLLFIEIYVLLVIRQLFWDFCSGCKNPCHSTVMTYFPKNLIILD